MSNEFRNLLADLLSNTEPFRDSISHLLLKKTESGDVAAAAKSRDGNIAVTARSKMDVPEFHDVACLGSLPFLNSIVNSAYFSGKAKSVSNMELNYDISSNGKTNALRSIDFTSGKKMEIFYQATDPYINDLTRVKKATVKDWNVKFQITPTLIADFMEALKIQKAAPKIGGDRDEVFTLSYTQDNEIIAVFGEKGHSTSIVLSKQVEESEDVNVITSLFSIVNFQAILKLVGKKEATCFLADKALKVEMETDQAFYSLMTTAKKLST